MKTRPLTFNETLKLMAEGWEMIAYGAPTFRRVLIKGNETRCGLHNPVSSRMFRAGLLEPSPGYGPTGRQYTLTVEGRILAEELKNEN